MYHDTQKLVRVLRDQFALPMPRPIFTFCLIWMKWTILAAELTLLGTDGIKFAYSVSVSEDKSQHIFTHLLFCRKKKK